ncbi:MAG TPA: helix-turn-helix domain-containing protein, partial [Puia sp.]
NLDIKSFRKKYKLSQEDLAKIVGTGIRGVQGWEQGVRKVPQSAIKLIEQYIESHKVPVVSGIPDVFKNEVRMLVPKNADKSEWLTNSFGNTFLPLDDGRYLMECPLVNEYVQGGPMAGFADNEYLESLPKHSVVVDRIHRGRYLSFPMRGHSMDYDGRDYIADGAILTARELKRELWIGSKLHFNTKKDYIIECLEGLIVKRIIDHDVKNYTITCHSLNTDKEKYPDFVVNLNEVLNIFSLIKVDNPR